MGGLLLKMLRKIKKLLYSTEKIYTDASLEDICIVLKQTENNLSEELVAYS